MRRTFLVTVVGVLLAAGLAAEEFSESNTRSAIEAVMGQHQGVVLSWSITRMIYPTATLNLVTLYCAADQGRDLADKAAMAVGASMSSGVSSYQVVPYLAVDVSPSVGVSEDQQSSLSDLKATFSDAIRAVVVPRATGPSSAYLVYPISADPERLAEISLELGRAQQE